MSGPPDVPAAAGVSTSLLVRAYLAVAAATLLWSANVVAVKLILREIPAFPAGLIRIILAALTLLAWHLLGKKPFPSSRAEWKTFGPLGIVGIAWSFLLFTLAFRYTSVAHAVFIGALTPIAVLLLVRVEGQERITLVKLVGLVVAFGGVVLLALDSTGGSGANWRGDLLALAGVWCFAYFTVRSKRLAARYDSTSLNTYAFLIAGLFCLPLLFLPGSGSAIPWGAISWVGWLSLFFSGTAGSAGAYRAYVASLRVLSASQVAAFQYVQPVIATLFGVWLLRENLGTQFVEGAALILIGVSLAERR
jgi:drug/metabolite transporter (DMT)-like permease